MGSEKNSVCRIKWKISFTDGSKLRPSPKHNINTNWVTLFKELKNRMDTSPHKMPHYARAKQKTFTDASVISWQESKIVVCRYLIVLCLCLPQWPLRDLEFYTGEYYLSLQHYDVFPSPNMWLCCGRVFFIF